MSSDRHLLTALLEESSDAVAVCDGALRVVRVNKAFEATLGYEIRELDGKPILGLARECNEPGLFRAVEQALETAGEWRGELACCARDGSIYQTEAVLKTADAGERDAVVLLLRDLFRQGASSSSGPQHDALTGLPNRFLLKDRLEQALVTAKRSRQSVGVITLGLDHFTRVNDGLGHDAGDAVLIEIAKRLKSGIRRSDTVARVGNDEFVLVLPMRSADDSVTVVEKLLRVVNETIAMGGQVLNITGSIGISVFPSDTEAGDGLLRRSNSAMHYAKRIGRNCYQFFSEEMNAKARQRIRMENDLRRALENGEFVLYYQPKVQLESGTIVGAEALLRWQDPERGLVPPTEFIPTAEESGLIQPIGGWVLEEACRQNSAWVGRGLPPVRVSVNMSAPQFHANDLVDRVTRMLRVHGLTADSLELEITESMLMGNPEQVKKRLEALREIGVHVSIDDFGTGYSSLSYLTRFPITTLKIDRTFIREMTINHNTAEVTRAIIGLSKGLKLEVVAEGVETTEHLDFLRENGCTTVQGFYYSRPVPAAEFEALLERGKIVR